MNRNKTVDMTQGRPMSLLLRFALPLMLGSLCQIMYSAADGAVDRGRCFRLHWGG